MTRPLTAAGLGLALCLAAGAFGASPLYVTGIALVLISVAAAARVALAARSVRVVRELSSRSVQEFVPLCATVRVARAGVALPGAEARAWPAGAFRPLRGGPRA